MICVRPVLVYALTVVWNMIVESANCSFFSFYTIKERPNFRASEKIDEVIKRFHRW